MLPEFNLIVSLDKYTMSGKSKPTYFYHNSNKLGRYIRPPKLIKVMYKDPPHLIIFEQYLEKLRKL